MSVTSRLCIFCSTVVSATIDTSVLHHSSATALLNSANYCHLCLMIWNEWVRFKVDKALDQAPDNIQFSFARFKHTDHLSLRLNVAIAGAEVVQMMNFWAIPIDGEEADLAPKAHVATSNTGSMEVLKIAAHWMDNCVKNHQKCNEDAETNKLPARVLDLGSPGSSKVSLHITTSDSPKAPYVTLSHCWGKIPVLRLQQDNLERLTTSISCEVLPKTFLDAIEVVRFLGLRFLWIDSLCIIQDSPEDWAMQSAVMGEIYRNSVCTIAATAAIDGRFGCFFARNSRFTELCKVAISTVGIPGDWSSISTDLYVIVPQYLWQNDVDKAPLNQRAWVLQERILSPRTIHFGRNQLLWECREHNACEMFPEGLPRQMIDSQGFKSLDPMTVGARLREKNPSITLTYIRNTSDPVLNSYFIWHRIVAAYMECSLTKDEDKLVAISAIVKCIEPLVDDTYLAGLWVRYLPYHLLWQVWPPQSALRALDQIQPYIAPSWSWASIKGSCVFFKNIDIHEDRFMIRILETKTTPKGFDPWDNLCTVI